MRFFPDRWAKVYEHWLNGIQDWCISRQLWWGHRVPVWYRDIDSAVLEKSTAIVREEWETISGPSARAMRDNAWRYAETHGLLFSDFLNLDCNFDITVTRASLAHGFQNKGLANIKLVPALPSLLRHAIRVATVEHEPAAHEVLQVHILVAALQLGRAAFRVKFIIKEFRNGRKLYDHHTLEAKKVETDGKYPPEEARLAASFAPWPASVSEVKMRDLLGDVNRDDGFTRCQIESPGSGWRQDPDVLDTWFSSWLWPFATMGWPEKTDTLAKFYPTTDLVTGPDIIFFWVARMIMAGYEYMGELPFRNVYFTSIIRDKQGRKLSKSLNNSRDPLDLIAQYGADALRFGTMRSAPLGSDVTYDEKNIELGRNFCTKLWNAARFRQMQGGETEAEIAPALLTSDDKWIVLRLDAAVREVSAALDEYRFSDATAVLYRFFWSEYCDWYVEASKASLLLQGGTGDPPVSSDPRRANTLAVMDYVLSHTLRLFHPFMPFITEELWQGMGFAKDLPPAQGGDTIMFAPWPKPLSAEEREYFVLDETDEQFAQAKYEVVNLGRGLRRDFNIASNKRVRFVLKPNSPLPAHEAAVLQILLNAEPFETNAAYAPPIGTPAALTPLGELFLPLDGLIDVAAERERLKKEIDKVEEELSRVRAKLADPNFAGKVPAKVLEEHRQREASWVEKLAQLSKMRDALGE
jgi:valyl-tRNA synthetase